MGKTTSNSFLNMFSNGVAYGDVTLDGNTGQHMTEGLFFNSVATPEEIAAAGLNTKVKTGSGLTNNVDSYTQTSDINAGLVDTALEPSTFSQSSNAVTTMQLNPDGTSSIGLNPTQSDVQYNADGMRVQEPITLNSTFDNIMTPSNSSIPTGVNRAPEASAMDSYGLGWTGMGDQAQNTAFLERNGISQAEFNGLDTATAASVKQGDAFVQNQDTGTSQNIGLGLAGVQTAANIWGAWKGVKMMGEELGIKRDELDLKQVQYQDYKDTKTQRAAAYR